jgi:ubiquinone/menaquinone biosynthesis C-methylase UbiE
MPKYGGTMRVLMTLLVLGPLVVGTPGLSPSKGGDGGQKMSTMTEAEWDAHDQARDTRYRLDKALDAVGIKPGMTVGEVGAGAGYVVFKLSGRVGPSGKVYAEDIVASFLNMLKTRATHRGLANIETILGTPDDAKLPAATFDLIFMHATMQFIEKPVAMFNSLTRSLKPEGKIVVIETAHDQYISAFREAGLKVNRLDDTLVPPFAVYVLSR